MRGLLLLCLIAACGVSSRVTEPDPTASTTATTSTAPTTATTADQPSAGAGATIDVKTVADPTTIHASASVPHQPRLQIAGEVKSLAGEPADDQIHWTIGVEAKGQAGQFELLLPKQIALPFKQGAMIKAELSSYGGGPNNIMTLLVTDASGSVLVAINRTPDGWSAGPGKVVMKAKGDSYDETSYTVKIGPKGKLIELGGTGWQAGTINGVRFYGEGSSVKRDLHGHMAPPDYVGAWTDFSLVRVGL